MGHETKTHNFIYHDMECSNCSAIRAKMKIFFDWGFFDNLEYKIGQYIWAKDFQTETEISGFFSCPYCDYEDFAIITVEKSYIKSISKIGGALGP